MGRKATDLSGRRFGFLVARKLLDRSPDRSSSGGRQWVCDCDCGRVAIKHSTMLRNGTSTHCSHSGKRWHERDAALRRQEAVQAVATQVGDDYHAVYGLRIEPHIQGRLFLTGEVTNTQRNGKPLGTWVTRVPDDAIAYEGADGVMHMPDEETVFVPAYGYKATCSCGAGVILKLEEVDGYETTTSPRFDCTGASVGDRIRIHKEPSGSPAWLPMCSE
jgi:hypothetical protein